MSKASLEFYHRNKEKYVAYRLANKEKVAAYKKAWYEKNKERILTSKKWSTDEAKNKKKEYDKQRYVTNKDAITAYEKERRKLPHRKAARNEDSRRRKMHIKQASPAWLSEFDLFYIKELYHLAQLRTTALGIVYHVDHIVPLRGKNVWGLHVPTNLQLLPAKENISKGNRTNFELNRKVYA